MDRRLSREAENVFDGRDRSDEGQCSVHRQRCAHRNRRRRSVDPDAMPRTLLRCRRRQQHDRRHRRNADCLQQRHLATGTLTQPNTCPAVPPDIE